MTTLVLAIRLVLGDHEPCTLGHQGPIHLQMTDSSPIFPQGGEYCIFIQV
jgi:hypothetical protein